MSLALLTRIFQGKFTTIRTFKCDKHEPFQTYDAQFFLLGYVGCPKKKDKSFPPILDRWHMRVTECVRWTVTHVVLY